MFDKRGRPSHIDVRMSSIVRWIRDNLHLLVSPDTRESPWDRFLLCPVCRSCVFFLSYILSPCCVSQHSMVLAREGPFLQQTIMIRTWIRWKLAKTFFSINEHSRFVKDNCHPTVVWMNCSTVHITKFNNIQGQFTYEMATERHPVVLNTNKSNTNKCLLNATPSNISSVTS